MYRNNLNHVIIYNAQSKDFVTREGLRQGGVMSLFLFNIYERYNGRMPQKKLYLDYRNLRKIDISKCVIADVIEIAEENKKYNDMEPSPERVQYGNKLK